MQDTSEVQKKPIKNRIVEFMQLEAAGGLVLGVAAIVSLLWVNSPLVRWYDSIFTSAVNYVINDGLMAVFFLLVGLEIKREMVEGELSTPAQALLPAVAAIGGMVVPMLVFWFFIRQHLELQPGIAIPAATDIAFSLGLLALFGRQLPTSLKVFLTALAIIDDLGAILLIALLYTSGVAVGPLLVTVAMCLGLLLLSKRGVQNLTPYLVGGAVIWCGIFFSGIHATVAGVLLAMTIPISDRGQGSPLRKLEHALHPWVAFGVIPIFVLANAGVRLGSLEFSSLTHPLPLAIALGLFLGKQWGVFGVSFVLIKFGIASLPRQVTWRQFYGVSVITGIGFTMSLFIGLLAFKSVELHDLIRVGVIVGSLLSAVWGGIVLLSARGAGRE